MLIRFLNEKLLQLVFLSAWTGCAAQGSALLLSASLALLRGGQPESPGWLGPVAQSSLVLGAIFLAGAVMLFIIRARMTENAVEGTLVREPRPAPNRSLLAVSLLALSGAGVVAAMDLLGLWREILPLLERAGVWQEFQRGGQFSGLLLLPILAALYAPVLETLAAFFLIAVPLLLVISLLAGSARFRMDYSRTVVCQAVLVVASMVAADVYGRLLEAAKPILTSTPDPMGHTVVNELTRGVAILARSARNLSWVLAGHVVWLWVALRRARSESTWVEHAHPAGSTPPG